MKHPPKSESSRGIAPIWGHAIGVLHIRAMMRWDLLQKKLKRILVVPTLSHRDDIVSETTSVHHRSLSGHQTTVAAPKVPPGVTGNLAGPRESK
jgi:hypothetical protein